MSNASTKVDMHEVVGLASGERLVGLDFRKNGMLYAVGSTSRLFSLAPSTATATAISFDVNAKAVPRITALAYAASGAGYALDAHTGSLVRIADAYSGELQTVGTMGLTASDVGGFDIAGTDAFAALRVGSVTSLYAVDLATGKVVSMGILGDGGPVTGLAIQP